MSESTSDQLFLDNHDDSNSSSSSDQRILSQLDMFEGEDKVVEGKNTRKSRRQKNPQSQIIPCVAVPEKIVICIDNSQNIGPGYCTSLAQSVIEPSVIRNEALQMFLQNKLSLAKETEFAVVATESGKLEIVSHFSSDIKHLVKSLTNLKCRNPEEVMTDYDITPIFSNVLELVAVPENCKSKIVPPDFVVRIILIYSNSHLMPRLNHVDKSYVTFKNSPYCVLDVLFLHETKSDFNNVGGIFKEFGKLVSPRSYLFECSRDVTQVFNIFAKLLAHPYQRVSQELWDF